MKLIIRAIRSIYNLRQSDKNKFHLKTWLFKEACLWVLRYAYTGWDKF